MIYDLRTYKSILHHITISYNVLLGGFNHNVKNAYTINQPSQNIGNNKKNILHHQLVLHMWVHARHSRHMSSRSFWSFGVSSAAIAPAATNGGRPQLQRPCHRPSYDALGLVGYGSLHVTTNAQMDGMTIKTARCFQHP